MYGPIIIDLEGTHLTPAEHALLQHRNTGGVLLFTRNYQNREQLQALVSQIRSIADKPLLLMTDHEGGRIWRFKEGFQVTPSAASFGEIYAHDQITALEHACLAGKTIARELLACDIDLTLAPVLDLETGQAKVIGDRSFGAEPLVVAELAKAFISGLTALGMAAVGKHFPGHGHCRIDTHDAIGKDERSLDIIQTQDLIPFAQLHHLLQGIMPAHVIYSAVDEHPAGFSKRWLQDILRQQIGFIGAIMSDCLSMKGTGREGDFLGKAHSALAAGCDLVILSQQTRDTVQQVLDALTWQVDAQQNSRIEKLAARAMTPVKSMSSVG